MRKILFSPIWSVLVLLLLTWVYSSNPAFLDSLRLRYFDQLIVNQEPVENNIYTVNIDEASLEEKGQWPWPRGDYSELIIDLYDRGAGLVVFNVLMAETDRAGEDQDLATTMKQLPVILNMLGADENKNEAINPGATIVNSDFIYLIPNREGVIANVPDIEYSAVGSGIVDTFPEADGVTRRMPMVIESQGTLYPSVTMEVLRVIAGDPSFQIKLNEFGVDKLRIPQFGVIQTSPTGEVWIDWSQRSKSVSAVDLPDDFEGAIVFVGPTAAGLTQPLATAAGSVFPHEVQAAMLGTVFNESNISRQPDAEAWAELAALVIAGLLLIILARWTYVGIAFFVLSVGGGVYFSYWIFQTENLLVDGFIPAAFLLLVGVKRYVIKFVDEFLQKNAIKKQFAGYASPEVVKLLQENPALIKEGVQKEISIVFSDLRGFTPLGESFGDDVKGLTKIMNGYMDAISEPILDSGGMVIKYIGDATMHIHNAPVDDYIHAYTSVQTAMNMVRAVEKFNQTLVEKGKPPVGMGAGINTGLGYLGEMGSTKRHSYDVLGDAVSTAARIESKCKEYGCVLLIGQNTYEKTNNNFFYLKVDDLAVKGKTVGVGIWTVIDEVKDGYYEGQKLHQEMHRLYQSQQFSKAILVCHQLRSHFECQMNDYYDMWIERCEYMQTQDLPADWSGVFIATTK